MIMNKEVYDRWRGLVVRYGGKVPRFDEKGSFDFFVAVCVAIPFDIKFVPMKKKTKKAAWIGRI